MQKTAEGSLYHRRDRGIRDKTKKPVIIAITDFFGAADQIRTGDLILTKDALYRLSYSSIKMATRNGLEPSTSSVTG